MLTRIKQRWAMESGYAEVLRVGLPLVVSLGSTTVMEFTDRVFLGNYSLNALAAATPAAITSFLPLALCLGTAGYLNVFVAQYCGSGAPHRVGAALWQGLYFCLGAGLLLASLYFIAPPLFNLVNHPWPVRSLEIVYFRILTLGATLSLCGVCLSTFFSGRGITRMVMFAHLSGMLLNIPLDYCLINGIWIFPELGIRGAGLATVTAWGVIALFFALTVFTRENNRVFGVWRNRGFERKLFMRFLRFGFPGGVLFCVDVFAFAFFLLMVGRLGTLALAASNIVFSINLLAFLPMVGLHIGLSTLVGLAVGTGDTNKAVQAVNSTLHLLLIYGAFMVLAFVFIPEPFLNLFRTREIPPEKFTPILAMGRDMLKFVAAYTLFDIMNLVYSGAIKGAGDVHFVMRAMGIASLTVLAIPLYLAVEVFHSGPYMPWFFISLYIVALGMVSWLRYRNGSWKRMAVVETVPAA